MWTNNSQFNSAQFNSKQTIKITLHNHVTDVGVLEKTDNFKHVTQIGITKSDLFEHITSIGLTDSILFDFIVDINFVTTIPNNRQITSRLFVGRTDGTTYEDITEYAESIEVDLGDIDMLGTGDMGGDSVVRQLDFTLINDRETVDDDSLHPLDKTSSWNIFDGGYNPLLWPLREVVLRIAIEGERELGTTSIFDENVGTGNGTSQTFQLDKYPVLQNSETVYLDGAETSNYTIDYDTGQITTDLNGEITVNYTYFRELFAGYLGDNIESSEDGTRVMCQARDYAKLLQDTFIETKREYGSDSGVPAETVIQNIMDDNMGAEAPTLYTPVSPGFSIKPYEVDYQSVWDAIQQVAQQIGWFLGYLWDTNTQQWRLTFKEPPRSKSTGDYILTAQDDFYTRNLAFDDTDIRNVVTVEYRDETTGEVETETVQDTTSINEFRRRAMTIGTKDTPLIDTAVEAQNFGSALLGDLKNISSTTRINMPILADLDLYDGLSISDPRLESETNFYGVESIRHIINPESRRFRTEVVAGGSIIGSKTKWLRMETRPGSSGNPTNAEQVTNYYVVPEPTILSYQGTYKGFNIVLAKPKFKGWDGFEVHASTTTSSFTPDSSTLVAEGKQARFEVGGLQGNTTYYVKVISYDIEGNQSPVAY